MKGNGPKKIVLAFQIVKKILYMKVKLKINGEA
jgi:hypothetical protein